MRCDEIRDLIEPIAAGDLTPDVDGAVHLESCARCAADLALARRLDRLLAAREAPPAPPHFTAGVLRRLRREWWRSERFVDLWFNLAVAAGAVLIVGGIWVALNLSGVAAVSADASNLIAAGVVPLTEMLGRIVHALPIYAAATALLGTALGLWWWAERGLTL